MRTNRFRSRPGRALPATIIAALLLFALECAFSARRPPELRIDRPSDVRRVRKRLVRVIWPGGFPKKRVPDRVVENAGKGPYEHIPGLERVDELFVTMKHGVESKALLFHAHAPKPTLVLYHHGHYEGVWEGRATIGTLVNGGYSVLAFAMPLHGGNNKPTAYTEAQGEFKLVDHEWMKFTETDDFHPLSYFLDPVVAGLNHGEALGFEDFAMLGLSGGGWTTTVAAAVDDRIRVSMPVAGSLPVFVRFDGGGDYGDWEQTVPAMLRAANYLELYTLGSHGDGRLQIHVLNADDPCCFKAGREKAFVPIVTAAVERLEKGSYEMFVDDSRKGHAVSPRAVQKLIDALERGPDADFR